MTTEQPDQPSAETDSDVAEKKAGFSFPFGAFKGGKEKAPLGYQPVTKSDHHKTPHRPPNGSRRSMGKR